MRKQSERGLILVIALLLVFVKQGECKPLRVVATTTDLAAVANEVGGGLINVEVLSRPEQDPHHFEILPQHVLAVRDADVYLKVGAGLDYWLDDLLTTAENSQIIVVDCSQGVQLIRDEEEEEEHGHGHHEHESGNPHYWVAPTNLEMIAGNITEGLKQADPAHRAEYVAHLRQFQIRMDSAVTGWKETLRPCTGAGIVTYHRSWDYLARDFDLRVIGTIEPQPGTEPSPVGLALLERSIQAENARILLMEPFAPVRLAKLLARDTGIQVVRASPSVGAAGEPMNIFVHVDRLVSEIRAHCIESTEEHE